MKVPYLLADAFTEVPGTGNRVALFLDARGLSPEQLAQLARRVGVRESAFVVGEAPEYFEVRFYTPEREIEFAGAAAIALGLVLVREGRAEAKERLFLRTPADTLALRIFYEEGMPKEVELREPAPRFREPPTYETLRRFLQALGGDERYLHRGLPVGVAYTGLWSLFIPLIAPGMVDALEPDMEALTALMRAEGLHTIHPYTPMGPRTYYARDFAPTLGIPEDPVTGSANGALGALLARAGVVPKRQGEVVITVMQGHHLGVPGEVKVRVEYAATGDPYAVYVAGKAALAERGVLKL